MFGTLAAIILYVVSVYGSTDLLASRNGDLEEDPITYWTAGGSTMVSSTVHVYNGSKSAYISGRTNYWEGIDHTFTNTTMDLTVDKMYAFVGHILLENIPAGELYVEVQVMLQQIFYNTTAYGYHPISYHTHTLNGSWVEVGGDFKLPDNLERIRIYIQVVSPVVNYYFDSASLVELVPDPNWMTTAEANIELYRKAKLDIIVMNSNNLDLSNYTMELTQDKSQFGHGTAIRPSIWNHPYYSDFVYNTLKAEWVTVEDGLSWIDMEAVEGTIVFDDVNTTLTDLKNHGISVRGYNMISAVQSNNPSWVQSITDSATMLAKLDTRITGTLSLTSGRVSHWNVINEELHETFMDTIVNDAELTRSLFRKMNNADPTPALFLNDYAVVNAAQYTTVMKEKAKNLKDANVPIYGIGAQGHFTQTNGLDVTRLKYRLDKLAEAGLPIWITEFSITETNVTAKTTYLEEALTMFFSHEKVEGVLLWGFWTGAINDGNNALATGSRSITLNAAGDRYVYLVNTKWRTNWSKPLASLSQEPCFKGDYSIYVKKDGVTIATQTFTLTQNNSVEITVSESSVVIQVGDNNTGTATGTDTGTGTGTRRIITAVSSYPPGLIFLLIMVMVATCM